jgi:aminoglycoside phosphotransferase (APT) family kinase protein
LRQLIRAISVRPIVERPGAAVYEAQMAQGTAFVKVSASKAGHERQSEILETLGAFPLTPKVLQKHDWGERFVLVMTSLKGTRLDHTLATADQPRRQRLLVSAGAALGKLHLAIPAPRLAQMTFWKFRDGVAGDPVSWNAHLRSMVSKWKCRVNPGAADYPRFAAELQELLQRFDDLREPKHLRLLHCDYIGRNILVNDADEVSGVLDFEASRVGDAAYDLAKIVWANMDFTDVGLRQAILRAWEAACGERVPQREFLVYVGIQCLAAIAWTDKNDPLEDGSAFRDAAVGGLRSSVHQLRGLPRG